MEATLKRSDRSVADELRRVVWWVTVAAVTIVGIVPLLGNELRVQDWDPQFARVIVERTHHFGGTFYENGIYNKGPLELVVYDVARHIGGYDGMWHIVSIFAALAALVVALVAARTAQWTGAFPALALATAVVVYMHLTVSGSDYAGVLYARNMTVALLAGAWLLTFEERFWGSPRARIMSAVVAGALLGVVAQTLLAEVFTAAVLGAGLLAMIFHRTDAASRRKLMAAALSGAAVAFLSAPMWYLLRGRFEEYWTSWYGHAHLMSVGTRRSLGSQFALGWDQLYAYYRQRPMALLVILAFAGLTYVTWAGASWRGRVRSLTLLGWLAASWLEQILNQRYSSHYFVVNTVPTALMIALLVGHAGRAASRNPRFLRGAIALPLVAVLGSLYVFGTQNFQDAVKRTSRFTSFAASAGDLAAAKGGPVQTARGVLDLVSRDNDPILAWTNTPWAYLDVRRVSAGRFIWKSFLTGEIYLGGSGPQYVLPHTWEWFREDVRRARPVAFVKTEDDPAQGTPFADLVRRDFQLLYAGKQSVYVRNDLAREVLSNRPGQPWSPVPGTSAPPGWSVGPGSVTYRGSPGAGGVALARDNCVRVDGMAGTEDGSLPAFDVRFDLNGIEPGDGLKQERLHLKLEGERAISGSDAVDYESVPSGVQPPVSGRVPFSLVVGRRAAVLVVGGQVRAAIRISRSVTVSLGAPTAGSVDLSDLRVSAPPAASGC